MLLRTKGFTAASPNEFACLRQSGRGQGETAGDEPGENDFFEPLMRADPKVRGNGQACSARQPPAEGLSLSLDFEFICHSSECLFVFAVPANFCFLWILQFMKKQLMQPVGWDLSG